MLNVQVNISRILLVSRGGGKSDMERDGDNKKRGGRTIRGVMQLHQKVPDAVVCSTATGLLSQTRDTDARHTTRTHGTALRGTKSRHIKSIELQLELNTEARHGTSPDLGSRWKFRIPNLPTEVRNSFPTPVEMFGIQKGSRNGFRTSPQGLGKNSEPLWGGSEF